MIYNDDEIDDAVEKPSCAARLRDAYIGMRWWLLKTRAKLAYAMMPTRERDNLIAIDYWDREYAYRIVSVTKGDAVRLEGLTESYKQLVAGLEFNYAAQRQQLDEIQEAARMVLKKKAKP